MRTILMGNAGSGKTTLARELAARDRAACLSLDDVAFAEGEARRPLDVSIAECLRFIEAHESWVIEGCYADIIEALLPRCEELVFLNPGVETCIARCRQRAWEPDKFPSPEAQQQHLPSLIDWVSTYETREDEYGLRAHRRVFDAFAGSRSELDASHPLPRS
jgi:adenylate kinase family enzyme